jgi:hypothetical protein
MFVCPKYINIISPDQKLMCSIQFHFLLVCLVLHNGILYIKSQSLYYVGIFSFVDDPELPERFSLDDPHYGTHYYYYYQLPLSAEIYSSLL